MANDMTNQQYTTKMERDLREAQARRQREQNVEVEAKPFPKAAQGVRREALDAGVQTNAR